jgi:hypothetical protein
MNLKDWINPLYLDSKHILKIREELISQEYVNIVALENFLNERKKEQLEQELQNCKKEYLKKETYKDGTLDIDFYSYQWEFITELKGFFHSETFLKYLSLFFWYKLGFMYDRDFMNEVTRGWILVQTFTSENHLNWHDDRDDAAMVLYYLNYDWTKEKWWELELGYQDEKGSYIGYGTITPEFNKLVLLVPKLWTYHRVTPVQEGYLRKGLVEHLVFAK